MALTETIVAFTALAIAVVALFVSLAQLLQQCFATAEGYRNCKSFVMGEWAVRTHRQFHPWEGRVEVFFEAPEIFLTGPDVPKREGQIRITGTISSRNETLTPLLAFDPGAIQAQPDKKKCKLLFQKHNSNPVQEHLPPTKPPANTANDLVCWLPLLHWLHEITGASLDLSEQTQSENALQSPPPLLVMKTIPALVSRKRSWDFQPPDVIRPLAASVVSDIVILARRMGMRWKDLRPEDGVMNAEGHCHVITSTVSRSLGIVLHYTFGGNARSLRSTSNQSEATTLRPDPQEVYIPTPVADKLGFGIFGGGNEDLELPQLRVASQWDIAIALDHLDASGSSGTKLRAHLKETPGFTFRIGDIVALTTPMAHQIGSSLVQVPSPSENVHGFTTSIHGRRRFRAALEDYLDRNLTERTSAHLEMETRLRGQVTVEDSLISLWPKPTGMQLELVREAYDKFHDLYSQGDHDDNAWTVTRDKAYLDAVHHCYDDLTKYLLRDSRYKYVDLLAHHIRLCVFRPSSRRLQGYSAEDEVSHWFREMEKIGDDMKQADIISKEEITEVWIVMMFRACCWGACHFLVSGERAPFRCYGSQLPVYIG